MQEKFLKKLENTVTTRQDNKMMQFKITTQVLRLLLTPFNTDN